MIPMMMMVLVMMMMMTLMVMMMMMMMMMVMMMIELLAHQCGPPFTSNNDYLYGLLGRLGPLGLHATIQKEADFSPTWLGPPGPHVY